MTKNKLKNPKITIPRTKITDLSLPGSEPSGPSGPGGVHADGDQSDPGGVAIKTPPTPGTNLSPGGPPPPPSPQEG